MIVGWQKVNELITVQEMAIFLKISRTKAYDIIKNVDFPKIKIDKSIRIIKSELLEWLKNHKNVI